MNIRPSIFLTRFIPFRVTGLPKFVAVIAGQRWIHFRSHALRWTHNHTQRVTPRDTLVTIEPMKHVFGQLEEARVTHACRKDLSGIWIDLLAVRREC